MVFVFTSLQLLRNHVGKVYRDSDKYFRDEEYLAADYNGQVMERAEIFLKLPGHGCGQGNGTDPTFWVLISSPPSKYFKPMVLAWISVGQSVKAGISLSHMLLLMTQIS